MTSSEQPAPAVGPGGTAPPATPASAAPPPLLQGHLHPAVLVLRLLDGLRQAAVPALAGLIIKPWLLAVAGLFFLLQVSYGLVRFLTFQYTLTATELRTREGILNRQERRIPIDRVQDLAFESTILRRVLGLVVVLVDTASGKGAEAVLDSLGRAEAEQLREVLLAARRRPAGADGTAPAPAAEPEWTVFSARGGELLLRGCTDLRVGALVVSAFAALQLIDQIGLAVRLRGLADSFFDWLRAFPLALEALVLGGLVALVLAVSTAASAIGNLMVFHGFQLTLRGDTLLRRYGLFTRRQKTLPRARVQRVTVEQTWLRRLLGQAVAYADSAGSGRGPGEESQSGFDVVVPLASLYRIQALLPALLVGFPGLPADYRQASGRLVLRVFLKGAVFAVLVAAASWPIGGPLAAAAALVLLPLGWVVGRLMWGNLGWWLGERHLCLRFGVLGRYQAIVPTAKVQAVVQRRGPLQQLLGLTDLTVYVAGGSPTRLLDLTQADAVLLQLDLAGRGALAAAQEWQRKNPLGPRPGGA